MAHEHRSVGIDFPAAGHREYAEPSADVLGHPRRPELRGQLVERRKCPAALVPVQEQHLDGKILTGLQNIQRVGITDVGLTWRGDNDSEELGWLGGHRSVSTLASAEVPRKHRRPA